MIDYEKYITSPEWRARAAALKARAAECATCPRTSGLEVHHRTYARLGHEHPSDLVVLCRLCHGRLHGTYDEAVERQLTLPMLPRGSTLN